MTTLDESMELICKYILIFNHNPTQLLIDYKQFAWELRKTYRISNYVSFTAGMFDEILESIDCGFTQKKMYVGSRFYCTD